MNCLTGLRFLSQKLRIYIKNTKDETLSRCSSTGEKFGLLLRLEFVKSLAALVRTDPSWALLTVSFKELGLLISAREVDLPTSLKLTTLLNAEDNLHL